MPVEIEVKLRLENPDSVRQRLLQHAPPTGPTVFEVNRLFDDPQRSLTEAGCGLRIREAHFGDDCQGILTYKGPRQPGPLKVREELESHVGDPALVAQILQRLGYTQRILYEKRRTTWHIQDCEVTLDEMPTLGWFAEIEGPSEQAVTNLLHELQLDQAEQVDESYVELTAQQGQPTEDGGRALRFA